MCMSFMYYDCMYHHRPMYIDSTSTQQPAGDQPVATELRKYVEPLLKVMYCHVCPCSLSPNRPDGSIQKLVWPFWGRGRVSTQHGACNSDYKLCLSTCLLEYWFDQNWTCVSDKSAMAKTRPTIPALVPWLHQLYCLCWPCLTSCEHCKKDCCVLVLYIVLMLLSVSIHSPTCLLFSSFLLSLPL